jgi:methionine-rich copper-binding protein CopC
MIRGSTRAAIVVAVLAAPAVALGHAALIGSKPSRGARLTAPPPRVELEFTERLEPAYSTASVVNAAGERVDAFDAAVAGDGRRLAVTLPPLGPGTYTVRYRVLSVDGHVTEGAVAFTLVGTRRGVSAR